jgi:hypothetical protein
MGPTSWQGCLPVHMIYSMYKFFIPSVMSSMFVIRHIKLHTTHHAIIHHIEQLQNKGRGWGEGFRMQQSLERALKQSLVAGLLHQYPVMVYSGWGNPVCPTRTTWVCNVWAEWVKYLLWTVKRPHWRFHRHGGVDYILAAQPCQYPPYPYNPYNPFKDAFYPYNPFKEAFLVSVESPHLLPQ